MPLVPLLIGSGGGGGPAGGATFEPDGATVWLEVAWGYTSEDLDADLVWTDETARLVSWRCGSSSRSTQQEVFQAGTATFVVDNSDRRYDPANSDSDLFASLDGNIGHPVRFRVLPPGGTTVLDRWRGFIDRIDQGRDVQFAGEYIGAVLVCSDGLADLAAAGLPESAWLVEAQRGVRFEDDGSAVPAPPVHHWRMGESAGTVCRDSTPLGSPANGTYVGTVAPTYNYRRGIVTGSPDGAIQFDGVDMHVTVPSVTLTPPFSRHCVIGAITPDRRNPLCFVDGAGSAEFTWEITAANEVKVSYHDGADVRTYTSLAQTWDPDEVYNLTCVVLANAAPKLYRDTVELTGGTASGSGTLGPITGTGYHARIGSDYLAAILDELLEYDFDIIALPGYGPGSTRADDLFDARRDSWDQDTFELRCKKILDAAEWPVDLREISTTSDWEYDPAEFAGRNALQYLQEVVRSEDGAVFATAAGKIRCEDRRERYTASRSTTSQATFSDDPAATAYRYHVITPDGYDRTWVRQRIVARRKYGSDLVAQDGTVKRGQSEDLGTLMLKDEAKVQLLVDRRLTARKTPRRQIRRITWSPRFAGGQWDAFELRLSDRITVEEKFPKRNGSTVGTAVEQDSWIEGIEDEGTTRDSEGGPRWTVTFTLSECIPDPD